MKSACIDTGVLTIYLSEDVTDDVKKLIDQGKRGEIELHILKPVLMETFKHLCHRKGIEFARSTLLSFLKQVPLTLPEMDVNLIIKAGTLKCQNDKVLSYIDSMCIAYALNMNMPLHTTENLLKMIPSSALVKLKIVKYNF